ncbi:MAG: beta-galactosidase [Halioglobus sp.]
MFGICYYPEQCSPAQWPTDAKMMSELGLKYVRIAEFSWSRLEPTDGELDFAWLDTVIDTLVAQGLEVVIGTPTATPPKWLIDKWPEILPVDPDTGRSRGFGSRRHYDFSSTRYWLESERITGALARRYGGHEGVVGWQTDNELGCHETTLSASSNARDAFRRWCQQRYSSIDALNTAWGNVFWSMEYGDFEEIELPVGTVTEPNPAHSLAFRRFSSDQAIGYHERMTDIIREHAPGKFVTHNFIPMDETGFDNWSLAESLDFASYDNYPLGRTDMQFAGLPAEQFRRYMRTGHPDFATYYHDQTRGLSGGGFWIMEQQPGPVNWAPNNPRPAAGMIRFWTLEAFAHGADCVCFFRWRQAAFAQEQMHAGLLRPDNSKSDAWAQVEQSIADIERIACLTQNSEPADIAIIAETQSQWVTDIERQSGAYDYNKVQFSYYRALRELGLNVDFISSDSDFSPYKLVLAPSLPIVDADFVERAQTAGTIFIFGPRSGSKTADFSHPANLAPGLLQAVLPIQVLSVETLRADCQEPLKWNNQQYRCGIWREEISCDGGEILAFYEDGSAAAIAKDQFIYLATLTDNQFLKAFFAAQCATLDITIYDLGEDVRVRRRGDLMFAFNYSEQPQTLNVPEDAKFILGGETIEPRDVCVWTSPDAANE